MSRRTRALIEVNILYILLVIMAGGSIGMLGGNLGVPPWLYIPMGGLAGWLMWQKVSKLFNKLEEIDASNY